MDHVSKYISEEIKYGAIWGPFKELPFPCHVSPFLSRDKPNSNSRRVILDLSFPVGKSVNDRVPKDQYFGSYFELKYPSVDDIVQSLKELVYLFGVLRRFQHCTGHITTGSSKGRGNQYIQFVRVLYCKLPTNGKQLPAFPVENVLGIEPWPQRWEARMLPLCHRNLKELGPTALLYKIDMSGAFRHIIIDPRDLDLLGLKHGGYYIDGCCHSVFIMTWFLSALYGCSMVYYGKKVPLSEF